MLAEGHWTLRARLPQRHTAKIRVTRAHPTLREPCLTRDLPLAAASCRKCAPITEGLLILVRDRATRFDVVGIGENSVDLVYRLPGAPAPNAKFRASAQTCPAADR